MVAQSAQLSMVDQLATISKSLERQGTTDKLTLAGSMVGKQITFANPDGVVTSGVVSWVRFDGDEVLLGTGAWEVPVRRCHIDLRRAGPTRADHPAPATIAPVTPGAGHARIDDIRTSSVTSDHPPTLSTSLSIPTHPSPIPLFTPLKQEHSNDSCNVQRPFRPSQPPDHARRRRQRHRQRVDRRLQELDHGLLRRAHPDPPGRGGTHHDRRRHEPGPDRPRLPPRRHRPVVRPGRHPAHRASDRPRRPGRRLLRRPGQRPAALHPRRLVHARRRRQPHHPGGHARAGLAGRRHRRHRHQPGHRRRADPRRRAAAAQPDRARRARWQPPGRRLRSATRSRSR